MSISLEIVAEKYLVAKKLSAGTRKEYRSTVTKWLAWGQGGDVDRMERHHIRDFLDWVHDTLRSRVCLSIRRELTTSLNSDDIFDRTRS
jgi:hypothetical protein